MCRSQTVTFDLFQTGTLKNKRIWVIWTLKKKNFSDVDEGTRIPKTSIPEHFFENVS